MAYYKNSAVTEKTYRQVNYHQAYTLEELTNVLGLNDKGMLITNVNYDPTRDIIIFMLKQITYDKGIPRMEVPEGQEAPVLLEDN